MTWVKFYTQIEEVPLFCFVKKPKIVENAACSYEANGLNAEENGE
jgi:hypothetical protein